MASERELRMQRERMAEKAGEGGYCRKSDNVWLRVEATFYPKTKLWLIEGDSRREITKAELARDFTTLKI